jgi:hypothetical protein
MIILRGVVFYERILGGQAAGLALAIIIAAWSHATLPEQDRGDKNQ